MTTENQLPAENQTTIAGDVTSGGDFVARDKTIHGDAVGGDKVGGDKVGGDKIAPQGYVAIGGQIVHVHLQTAAVAMPTPDQEEPSAGDSPYQELNYFGFCRCPPASLTRTVDRRAGRLPAQPSLSGRGRRIGQRQIVVGARGVDPGVALR
ncbi:MAG: hypothetical protein R2932_20990 [Caldilineaceae bacterium]